MQMLNTKFYYLFFLSLLLNITGISTCVAQTSFIEQFQTKPKIDAAIADRITEYYSEDILLPLSEQKKELLSLSRKLDQLSSQYNSDATYWFIRGLQQKNLAALNINSNKSKLAAKHINKKNMAYEKAMLLDKNKKELTAAIFSTMKPGLPERLKISATKNEIASGGNADNDSYYWYLHWSNIDQLKKAGRDDEAKAAYKKMQKELKSSNMDMSIYGSLTQKIESKTFNNSLNPDKEKTKKIKPKKKTPESQTEPETKHDKRLLIILALIMFSLVSIIGVAIYDFRKKRNRK